mgnify:CR=1 FL=1
MENKTSGNMTTSWHDTAYTCCIFTIYFNIILAGFTEYDDEKAAGPNDPGK